MERNFNQDHFEQFLRDSVEDFRMTPSRRVWTSLYNNLHPGRRWPSLAVSLLVFSALIFVGLTHSSRYRNQATPNETVAATDDQTQKSVLLSYQPSNLATAKPITEANPSLDMSGSGHAPALVSKIDHPSTQGITYNGNGQTPATVTGNSTYASTERNNQHRRPRQHQQAARNQLTIEQSTAVYEENQQSNITQPDLATSQNTTTASSNQPTTLSMLTADDNATVNNNEAENVKWSSINQPNTETAITAKLTENKEQKAWMESDIFYNKRSSLHKQKLSYEVYITPSVGYRKLENMMDLENASISLSNSFLNTSNQANKIHHLPAFNMEAGYSVRYDLNKYFRMKAGFQFNYSNYQIYGQGLDHPAATSLLLRNSSTGAPELISRSSVILNPVSTDQTNRLNSSNFQVSIPIGAEIKLMSGNKWQWYVGATIQPTYVLSGNAYLLSADMNYYVFDASMINKWNLNTGVETFVSYKMNQKLQLNMGPQFRYQLNSTYDKQYTYKEKLYNLGIKLGIVQRF